MFHGTEGFDGCLQRLRPPGLKKSNDLKNELIQFEKVSRESLMSRNGLGADKWECKIPICPTMT
jgi:hypothetical protein